MFTAWSFNVFFFFTAVNVLLAIVISFYPETRGVALEDIDELFDGKKVESAAQKVAGLE
ncbi:hypothetical protein HDU82_005421 [Entophlyctis luteolus]|nr:hypothetical protein HDU82_005421 [Entophlyctis luteolus]